MDDLRESIFRRLKHSVQLLASSPEVQLRLLPPFVCKADELALDFDHWCGIAFHNYGSDLNADQQSALKALDQKFSWLTKNAKEEWTDQAIRESGEWQEIRFLATHILDTFGWPIETPPSYSHEYISSDPTHFRN
jgi:hypothetical protein